MNYTNKSFNTKHMDLITTILVIDGKMYTSWNEIEAFQRQTGKTNYFKNLGIDIDSLEGMNKAFDMLHDMSKNGEIYKFQMFTDYSGQEPKNYLTTHFESNFKACEDKIRRFARRKDCTLGIYVDQHINTELALEIN